MTNRKQYAFFTQWDDPQLDEAVEKDRVAGKGSNTVVMIMGTAFEIHKKKSSLGEYIQLKCFGSDESVFSTYLSQDCPTIKDVLEKAKSHAESVKLKRIQNLIAANPIVEFK